MIIRDWFCVFFEAKNKGGYAALRQTVCFGDDTGVVNRKLILLLYILLQGDLPGPYHTAEKPGYRLLMPVSQPLRAQILMDRQL